MKKFTSIIDYVGATVRLGESVSLSIDETIAGPAIQRLFECEQLDVEPEEIKEAIETLEKFVGAEVCGRKSLKERIEYIQARYEDAVGWKDWYKKAYEDYTKTSLANEAELIGKIKKLDREKDDLNYLCDQKDKKIHKLKEKLKRAGQLIQETDKRLDEKLKEADDYIETLKRNIQIKSIERALEFRKTTQDLECLTKEQVMDEIKTLRAENSRLRSELQESENAVTNFKSELKNAFDVYFDELIKKGVSHNESKN